jgi:putative toxin-antitoxin system antitoxin component (TIGR02293 family)
MAQSTTRPPSQAERIIRVLGGKEALGASPATTNDFIQMLREGITYRSLESATATLDIPLADLSRLLGLKPRTLARRRSEKRLNPTESERVLRFARIVARAEEVLGDEEAARGWLRDPNGDLGGKRPIDFLDTDIGADAVLTSLGRLEHGIFS